MGYRSYIIFKTIIPHELLINGGPIELIYDGELGDGFLKRTRHYRVFVDKKFIENQSIPSENSTFSKMLFPAPGGILPVSFSYYVSKIEVHLELFEEEPKLFNNHKNNSCASSVFQNIMLSFSRYYNEMMKGNDFLKPMVYGYGPQIYSVMTNNGKKELYACIAGSFSLERHYKQNIDNNIGRIEHHAWRYYYYKAIDCYDTCEYLDSIIWCAVSFETYIMKLINMNGLENKNDEGSVFKEIKLLKEKNIISVNEYKQMNKVFSSIKDYRNEIIHGDIDSTFYSKIRAKKSIDTLRDYYSSNGMI